jgi:hypothetical protein
MYGEMKNKGGCFYRGVGSRKKKNNERERERGVEEGWMGRR